MRLARLVLRTKTDILVWLAGFVFGALVIGFRNLNPTSIEWLQGDARLAQIGHEFFWRSPWLQFPFNATSTYGLGWRTGLNQSSQNTLFPLFFKPFTKLSDSGFQIQGIWLSSCFAAQAIIARKIFATLKLRSAAQLLGVTVVVLSPSLFSRIGTLWHPQLAAHWLILLVILMYLRRSPIWTWLLVISFSFSVHVYLCVIVVVVAVAALFNQQVLTAERGGPVERVRSFLLSGALVIAVLGVSTVVLGFGTFVGNPTTVGVGRYRLNMLSFVNPGVENYGYVLNSTEFFRNRSWLSEENEGFAYLGLGVLLALVVLIVLLALRVLSINRSHAPMMAAAALLFLVSLSDHVAIGTRDVKLPVPPTLIELRQTFRAATRFSWLAYYLLIIGGWYAVAKLASRLSMNRIGLPLMSMVVIAQLVDVGPGVVALHRQVRDTRGEFAPTLARDWTPVIKKYRQISIVPSVDANEDDVDLTEEERTWFESDSLMQLAWLASINDVDLNFSFCSRSCLQSARRSTDETRGELSRLGPNDGTIYVFASENEWRSVAVQSATQPEIIGGLRVLLGTPLK